MGLLEDYEQQFGQQTAEITSNIGRLSAVSIGKSMMQLTYLNVTNFSIFLKLKMTEEI